MFIFPFSRLLWLENTTVHHSFPPPSINPGPRLTRKYLGFRSVYKRVPQGSTRIFLYYLDFYSVYPVRIRLVFATRLITLAIVGTSYSSRSLPSSNSTWRISLFSLESIISSLYCLLPSCGFLVE